VQNQKQIIKAIKQATILINQLLLLLQLKQIEAKAKKKLKIF
jgi:hypothetical protein